LTFSTRIKSALSIFFFVLHAYSALQAQTDSLLKPPTDSRIVPVQNYDATVKTNQADTPIFTDSLTTDVLVSSDALDTKVDYSARDSMLFDNANNKVHLYGNATVKYRNLNLTADYIVIDLKNNTATAEPVLDSLGKSRGVPKFKDETQEFTAKKMLYNFKSKKGIVYDITTKQNDLFVHGGKSKFISTEGDSAKRSDIAYSSDAIFTTCAAEHPHFGIASKKQKLVPDKVVIVGPSNLVIGDIPTPLWLPFGFFPLSKGKKTGLIFPKNYDLNPTWGFGLQGIGYYFPLGEHRDLTVTGDVYFRGTWGLSAESKYVRLYKNSGSFRVGFRSNRTETPEARPVNDRTWNFFWSHQQDSRANPRLVFGASVDFQIGNYRSQVFNDYSNATAAQANSRINFTRTFPGKPYSLSGDAGLTQNVNTRVLTAQLPNLNFQMQTLFPFKRKERVGNERWYEKVTLSYNSSLRNQVTTTDSALFTRKTLNALQFGVQHVASANASFLFLKYFNFTPSVGYTENWYAKETRRSFDPTDIRVQRTYEYITLPNGARDSILRTDTTAFGRVDTTSKFGFYRAGQLSASAAVSTRIFGTLQFKKGWLRGIRHTISPSLSLNYAPDYRTRYVDSVQTSIRNPNRSFYSRYEGAPYAAPQNSGAQLGIGYGFTNFFDLKYFKKTDSTFQKMKLLENINVGGSYNMIADSFRWSPVSMNTGTSLFKGLTSVGLTATFDPYAIDSFGRRLQTLSVKSDKKLLRFVNFTASINTSLSVGQIMDLLKGKVEETGATNNSSNNTAKKPEGIQELSFGTLLRSFSLVHSFSYALTDFGQANGGLKSQINNNTISTRGDLPISKKWRISVGNIGYDFISKRLTYPDLTFYRDLHCWEMGVSTQPDRGTYSFFLRVKPGTLDFIKVPYNRSLGESVQPRF
jgi:hypothetical protein